MFCSKCCFQRWRSGRRKAEGDSSLQSALLRFARISVTLAVHPKIWEFVAEPSYPVTSWTTSKLNFILMKLVVRYYYYFFFYHSPHTFTMQMPQLKKNPSPLSLFCWTLWLTSSNERSAITQASEWLYMKPAARCHKGEAEVPHSSLQAFLIQGVILIHYFRLNIASC